MCNIKKLIFPLFLILSFHYPHLLWAMDDENPVKISIDHKRLHQELVLLGHLHEEIRLNFVKQEKEIVKEVVDEVSTVSSAPSRKRRKRGQQSH